MYKSRRFHARIIWQGGGCSSIQSRLSFQNRVSLDIAVSFCIKRFNVLYIPMHVAVVPARLLSTEFFMYGMLYLESGLVLMEQPYSTGRAYNLRHTSA